MSDEEFVEIAELKEFKIEELRSPRGGRWPDEPLDRCFLDLDSPSYPPTEEEFKQCDCSSCRDRVIVGLIPKKKLELTLNWNIDDLKVTQAISSLQQTMEEISKGFTIAAIQIKKLVKHLFMEFSGEVGGRRQNFRIFYPMDRRQARRLSRKTGMKFRVVQGEIKWNSESGR